MKMVQTIMLSILLATFLPLIAGGQKKPYPQVTGLEKTTGTPSHTSLNINRLSTAIYSAGGVDRKAGSPGVNGLVYPKETSKSAVYATGLMWAFQYGPQHEIRMGGNYYGFGMQPGKILPGLIADSAGLPWNRIYRVRKDIPPGSQTADVSSEIRDGEGTANQIYDQYQRDWLEWPWQSGAPYDDRNKNGRYDPSVDIPGFKGADQTIWTVVNDLNPGLTNNIYGAVPSGMEMQLTAWAYDRQDGLGYMYFSKYLLINKSKAVFDSMYVTIWSDADLGDYSDDLVGCDTTRSLGFVYNGKEVDNVYSPLPPPAIGFDFFQGPVVPGNPTDSALFTGKWVRGKRNLPMTTFYGFDYGIPDANFQDPDNITQWYTLLKGFNKFGSPIIDPQTGAVTKYRFAGDPEKRTGWIDGKLYPPSDRRLGSASGPFTMAPGDSQEVVIAEIAAGAIEGCDRISAIGLLKFYDDQGQIAFDNQFDLATPPTAPKVSYAELEREIVLSWGDDVAAVNVTEASNSRGYAFQGYTAYQFPSADAAISAAKRLETFDIVDGVGKIFDKVYDPAAGSVITTVRQFGSDAGIQRSLSITSDIFHSNNRLVNGTPYYFAVTAYNYNPDQFASPSTLETSVKVITVIPHAPDPGTRYAGAVGDTIKPVTQTTAPNALPSDGQVVPVIIDPTKLTGHQYQVLFDSVGGSLRWRLKDASKDSMKLVNQTNISGDNAYYLVDGMQVKVIATQQTGMRTWLIPSGSKKWTSDNAHTDLLGIGTGEPEGFGGAIGNAHDHWFSGGIPYQDLRTVLIKFAQTDTNGNVLSASDPNLSYAYRYLRNANAAQPAKPEFAPYIINRSGTYAYQDYVKKMPLAAYDIETNPPRRLMVGFVENNVLAGTVDGKYWPPDSREASNVGASGPREWLLIFDVPYSETPDPNLQTNPYLNPTPMMWFCTPARQGNVAFGATDQFLISRWYPFTTLQTFSFTAPTNTIRDGILARGDLNQVGVFPNPYYAVNQQELKTAEKFITFSHLPSQAIIRIFNLGGVMVRRLNKDSPSQFLRWDLKNESGLPVGSGLYIAYIEMPDLGVTKTLKLAIVQEQQVIE